MKYKFLHFFYIICLGAGLLSAPLQAQNVYYSQFHQTPMITNPAMVAASDQMQVSLQYRSQLVGAGQAFTTPMLAFSYPLISTKTGHRWGGIGAAIIQDAAGQDGILKTTGGSVAFAYNFKLGNYSFLSVGAQGGYFQRVLDESKLTTGLQWDNIRRTFDPNLSTGEAFQSVNVGFITAETGAFWHLEDTLRRQRGYIGLAARQLNQPNISFTELGEDKLPLTLIATAGLRAFQTERYSIFPNMRYVMQGQQQQINVGSAFRYHFAQETTEEGFFTEASLGFNAWYSLNNAVIVGIELNHKKYAISFAYDFSLSNPENLGLPNGATELSVGLRKDLGQRRMVRPDTTQYPGLENPQVELIDENVALEYIDPRGTTGINDAQFELLQRSILFPYKDAELSDGSKLFLDRIVRLLNEYKDMKLEISGHSSQEGNETANKAIAEQRAIAVYQYLLSKGVATNRLAVRGYAEKRPIAPNQIEAGRIRNRRVEFRVIKSKP